VFTYFDIWKVLAGVAVFLLGIRFLEESLQQLAGRRFKLFLKKQTSSKPKAIAGGAVVTAVLQSSSVVSLMVLAFVGAGIIATNNALAIILGANLGTTFTGWIIALVGFKVNIENLALPVLGLAGIGFAISGKVSKGHDWFRFFMGLSFLFVGLGYIKTGIEELVTRIDLAQFSESPTIFFLLIGFLITSVIQSSSATVAITLSALHANAITLFDGIAIVLGSEIGTTIKLFIASVKGISAKRRVALGNFLFNTAGVILVFIFLTPIYRFITDVIGIRDKLIAVVFFQSLVNVMGIVLFYPFLNYAGRQLEKLFRNDDDETMFIHKVASGETSMALFALEEETRHFIAVVRNYALNSFGIRDKWRKEMRLSEKFLEHDIAEKYEHIKFLYGEIHSYYILLQKSLTGKEETEKLDRLMSSVRNAMYAGKSFKDALPDKEQLHNSSNDIKFAFYNQTKTEVELFCEKLQPMLQAEAQNPIKDLTGLYNMVTTGYTTTLQQLYKESIAGHVSEKEITTMLNFNREIFTGFKSFLFALKDYLLDREQAKYFDEQPGFIR
jgi:phosphate:Na+ symporter